MSWNEAYALERRTALDPVDGELRMLPAALREEGRLFRANLLAASEASGMGGVFSGPHDYPALFLHHWVLECRPEVDRSAVTAVLGDLTRAAFYTAAAVRLSAEIADPASLTTDAARPLLDHFRSRAVEILAGLHFQPSPIREMIRVAWSRFDEGIDRLAPHKLPALSAWRAAGRETDLPRLDRFLDLLNGVYRCIHGFRSLERDLRSGRRDGFVRGCWRRPASLRVIRIGPSG